jgi:hypothetical protein
MYFLGCNAVMTLQADTSVWEEHTASILNLGNGGSTFHHNVGIYLQVHTAFQLVLEMEIQKYRYTS